MEPRRLIDGEGNDFEQALLRSARADGLSRRQRRRLMLSLGVVTAGAGALTAKLGFAAHVIGKAASAVGVKVALLAVVGGSVYLVARPGPRSQGHEASAPPPAPARAAPSIAEASPSVAVPDEPAPALVGEPASPAFAAKGVVPAPRRLAARKHRGAPVAEVRKEPPLAVELRWLEGGRDDLEAGRAAEARRRMLGYLSRFPSGRLRLEAEVLLIEALVAEGNGERAREVARALLRNHPDSAYAARVRSAVAGSSSGFHP